jgi:LuxR family transcriptional regulator, regulator of acetate metabolism
METGASATAESLRAALEVLGRDVAPADDAPAIDGPEQPEPGTARSRSAHARMRRLAGDLHDGAIQALIVAGYDLVELVETGDLSPAARELAERVASRIDESYDQMRQVLTELSREDDPGDPDIPLVDALRACCARGRLVPEPTRLVTIGTGAEPVGTAREVTVRTVREGLANARKHAVAGRALVTVRRGRRWWKVDVDDDGTGDEHELRNAMNDRHGEAYGLRSLAREAAEAGGRLWVTSAPALGGIRLSVSVPVRL